MSSPAIAMHQEVLAVNTVKEVVAVVQHEVRVSEDAEVKEVGAPVDEMKNPL